MLEVNRTVLIIIDVQEKLTRVMHEREALISNLQRLVKGMAVLEIPEIITEQYPQGLGPTIPEITGLLVEVSPISKTVFSCWNEEKFVSKLKSLQRTQVLICGIEGHVCVYQTACDLIANGYETYAVTDTITSRTPDNRQLSFEMMKQAGVRLTGTETVLFELLKIAQGEKFKKISQIVK
jgi:nicotinamidase-related amidase